MRPILILAGGLATRLRPITQTIPKSMVEVGGKPFIHHQLTLLREKGISHVVLCVGHLSGPIEAYVGDGAPWGLKVSYSRDGDRLLGTGGAVKKALPLVEGDAFFVLYGDSYLDIDYRAVEQAFADSAAPALMTVLENNNRWDSSNVLFEGGRIRLYSKREKSPQMRHIDYGLGVLRGSVLEEYPDHEPFDLAAVYEALSRKGRLAGHEVHRRFYEIGSLQGIGELEHYLREYKK